MSDKNKVLLIKIVSILVIIILIVGFIVYKIIGSKKIKDIKIYNEYVELALGDSYAINYVTIPESAKNEELVWQTDNEDVVSIDHGVVTTKNVGSAGIWVSPKNNPTIKKSLKISVATKKNRFKQRLVSNFEYEKKEENLFSAERDKYIVDLNNYVFQVKERSNIIKYYFLEGIVIVEPESQSNNSRIRFNIETNQAECTSSDQNWCSNNQITINERIPSLLSVFKTYLGSNTTLADLK